MAWTAPSTWVAGNVLTAAQLNQQLRDNMLQTAPALASAAGQLFLATAANTIAARTPDVDLIATSESTTSTSYTALATPGPIATCTTGTKAWVQISSTLTNATLGNSATQSYAISGATTLASGDGWSLSMTPYASNIFFANSRGLLIEGLTGGSNVFTCQYKSAAATNANFRSRDITVIPMS